jgi:hypothetical protein
MKKTGVLVFAELNFIHATKTVYCTKKLIDNDPPGEATKEAF